MSSLKDALLKAGLKTSKIENERKAKYKKDVTKTERHQSQRNYCEQCNGTYPDVEKFKHRNYSIDAEWMCVNCADMAEIHDDLRVTNQSEFSRTKRYIRRYGPTKVFEAVKNLKGVKPNEQRKDNRPRRDERDGRPRSKRTYGLDENGDKNFNR